MMPCVDLASNCGAGSLILGMWGVTASVLIFDSPDCRIAGGRLIGRAVHRCFRKHETHPFDAGWVVVELRFHANALRRASATTENVHGLMSHQGFRIRSYRVS